ncbi:sensor histidine kinase [Aquincola sp. S2]|uniref:Sensor histidine kinase n=1 Tax=Pseudaquabacterium terrae TaxID=2732868 RepID=A0ABX2EET7_9BURK|nr:sensor histidine kinase [Aquabacterium terrae]NRF67118.1 sensor histidine kinase [Aquabacterium terrae]
MATNLLSVLERRPFTAPLVVVTTVLLLFLLASEGSYSVAALSAASLIALVLFLRQTAALARQQREAQQLVQSANDRLQFDVTQRTAQLTDLTQHLQTAREDERNRLARELHDELGSLLTSARLDAARIKSRLAGSAPDAQERLAHLVETLNSIGAMKARIIENLRPSALTLLGLATALQILCREFTEVSDIEVHCAIEPIRLRPNAELVVYRLVQEAVNNITKYAQARNVWIKLALNQDEVQASVRDDGIGFDPHTATRAAYGLVGMRFRVEAEGGTLAIESSPGQGALILMSLPVSTLAAAAAVDPL